MTGTLHLTAADGHTLTAYEAAPDQPRGGIVVLQEIFGVNHHIRSVCDRLAQRGYHAIAPSLFDRQAPGFESGYSEQEIAQARSFLRAIDWDAMLLDLEASAIRLKERVAGVAALGFCLGGSLAYLAATRGAVDAAVCYYGGQIAGFSDLAPKVPTLLHFGRTDHTIPLADVAMIAKKQPQLALHLYDAGHGFNCDERAGFEPQSAHAAWSRSLDFLEAVIPAKADGC